ncbi:Nn.00g022650.m01.CDS01 [Neocucurbitaria sp. VM-36]
MAEEQAAHHLLNVLEERGLNVDLDKILLGFENEETKQQAAAWVEEYLHEDTLLTKEELELYQTLKKKGLLHQYESEGEPVRPILDQEIASAIESLQSSTAAIEQQCKVLEVQKAALMRLKALDKPNMTVEHTRNERRRKEGQEKARLDVAVDDVSTSVIEQLAEAQREIDTEKSTLKSYLAERLSSDDQILSRLPGIVSQIMTEPQASEDEKSVEQWCKAIIAFRTAEIKARVDTVYLNTLSGHSVEDSEKASNEEMMGRKAALQAEMEELHSEIASVAEMVVEHDIRKPMTEMKDRKDRENTQARGAWLSYVLSTLEYMGKRLDTITNSANDFDEIQQALAHINSAAVKRVPDTHAAAPTLTRKRTTSGPSAFTPMVKLKPTKTFNLPAALQDALRHAGISFNQDNIEALQDSLIQAQLERDNKLQDHYESNSNSMHDRLAERSSKADGDLRVILNALYKHTPFQQISLTKPKIDEQLKAMERELEEKDRDLLDAEGNELSLSDPKVQAFIARYGK